MAVAKLFNRKLSGIPMSHQKFKKIVAFQFSLFLTTPLHESIHNKPLLSFKTLK